MDHARFIGHKVQILHPGNPHNEKVGVLADVDGKIATIRLDGYPPRFNLFDDRNYGLAYVNVQRIELVK